MSDASTRRLIDAYVQDSMAPMFLGGFFQTPPQNFYNSEKVEIDVMRDDEDVAIAVEDLSSTPRQNENTLYTNKAFTPPIFMEEGTINSFDLIKRMPGQNPFENPDYAANAYTDSVRIFRKMENKLRRACELMVSQLLTTGTVTCVDANANQIYTINFLPKSTHFITSGNLWSGGSANPLGDLASLTSVIRQDGRMMPSKLVFGTQAWSLFLANTTVQNQINKLGIGLGQLNPAPAPATRGVGATFQGYIWIGNYKIELWTYDGWYLDPVSKTHLPYVPTNKVIVLCDGARLDMSYGAIPMLRSPESQALNFLPPRINSGEKGFDMTVNSWFTPDGRHLKVSAGTRPLPIPTAIDTFGCLTVA
jgi:hypothetical protein